MATSSGNVAVAKVDDDEHEDAQLEQERENLLDDPMNAAREERGEREDEQESDHEPGSARDRPRKKKKPKSGPKLNFTVHTVEKAPTKWSSTSCTSNFCVKSERFYVALVSHS